MTGRPPCDCGHAFERDPRWFHLGGCAYRESFRLPAGTAWRFAHERWWRWAGNLTRREWAAQLRAAERRYAIRRRRASRIPTIRTAYARTRRARRHH